MKRNFLIKTTVVLALIIAGFYLIKQPEPVPAKDSGPKSSPEASAPSPPWETMHRTSPNSGETAAPADLWQERLSRLQADAGDMFGTNGEQRMWELQDFVEGMPPAAIPAALKKLDELQMQNRTGIGQNLELRLLRRWGEDDAGSAAAWAAQTPAPIRAEALQSAASTWARKDFTEAAAWAGQLADATDRQTALKSVMGEGLYTDPKAALGLAAALPPDSGRNELVTRAAETWATQSSGDALAWANQITDQDLKAAVTSVIAITMANTDPVAGGNLAVTSLPPGPLQNQAVVAIVERWAQADMDAATQWVNQFPDGALKQAAQSTLNHVTARRKLSE